jgi:hypothetical protein
MSQKRMPWAISFYDFKVLKKSECYRSVQLLCEANSGGTDNSDWYKDPGNRNLDKIQN